MELPRNITQIGESDKSCKIYVEDYVVSYIKQRNRMAESKRCAVALYGIRKEENDISYLFLYGAGKLDSIQREVRHLSQAQNQEIESIRRRYFQELQFLGYRLLDGEMVEGFHICEQGICRYISGYAQFYEKNDIMLAYMLDTREDEPKPEEVDQEKYERVKQRQEERRSRAGAQAWQPGGQQERTRVQEPPLREDQREEYRDRPYHADEEKEPGRAEEEREAYRNRRGGASGSFREYQTDGRSLRGHASGSAAHREEAGLRGRSARPVPVTSSVMVMRTCIVGAFVLLCVVGLASMNGGFEGLQVAARQFVDGLTEQKIPDSVPAMNQEGPDMLVTEDKLTDAIQKENQAGGGNGQAASAGQGNAEGQPGMESGQGAGVDGQAGQVGQPGSDSQAAAGAQTGTAGQPGADDQAGAGGENAGGQAGVDGQAGAAVQPGIGGQTGTAGQPGADVQAGAGGQTGADSQTGNAGQAGTGGQTGADSQTGTAGQTGADSQTGNAGQTGADSQTGNAGQADAAGQTGTSDQTASSSQAQAESRETLGPVGYVIQKGDTLIGISLRQYGTDSRVQEICDLNRITDPDNIQIGQKILLPR